MTIWAVRAGKYGEGEKFALDNSCVVVGWDQMPDLKPLDTRQKMRDAVEQAHADISDKLASNWTGQLWAFRSEIKAGDLIVLPLKGTGTVAVGEALGRYEFRSDASLHGRHTQALRWLDVSLSRARIDSDILYSLGSTLTVFRVQRAHAEERLRALLGAKGGAPARPAGYADVSLASDEAEIDLRTSALDQIRLRIAQRFKGHRLANLVDAVLRAKGFETKLSLPGADGGVDILAAQGFFSEGAVSLVVQVKSEDRSTDAPTVRQLIGTMDKFQAARGLFVSWGGFKSSVEREFERDFFRLQFWTSDKLIEEILSTYDRFDESLKALLPLERVWMLVQDAEDEEP
ncbi:MAG TPA: restriction endonuclease [Beijerinckiaceae bacterium]|nr:restriction endonuclease [Beijerinckiaceae bacterium]